MAFVIGIDTGGTYTDAVLLDTNKRGSQSVKRKSKAFTTKDELEVGIRDSIQMLKLTPIEIAQIEKVVLSTTLATNAIVEGNIHKVGLILIGDRPKGDIATEYIKVINGSVNIKGRILIDVNKEETVEAVKELLPNVNSIAVSGLASVRNPILEEKVKEIIQSISNMPVICGHELVSDLGFLERTNTAVINAGLLPIINTFIKAIKTVLERLKIKAPVFVVKGDGSITKIDAIQNTPIDTVLSGPAASMIGVINLTGIKDTIVADMGGTTTDTGIVSNKRVELSPDGATIGNWKIRIKTAKLFTFGLGGDSLIGIENGKAKIGPKRVLPACRGGGDVVTPTDILHFTGEFEKWSKDKAASSIEKQAKNAGIAPSEYVEIVKAAISKKIVDENVLAHKRRDLPISAIGAPAKSWYRIAKEKYNFNLVIPEHFEVANAVGAATAGIQEVVEALVRPGEEGYGYLAHTRTGRYAFAQKEEAVNKAIEVSRECAINIITEQNLELGSVHITREDIFSNGNQLIHNQIYIENNEQIIYESKESMDKYLETRIKVAVIGILFVNEEPVMNITQ